MKKLHLIILLICITNWTNIHTESVDILSDKKEDTNIQKSTQSLEPDTVIHFFTQDDDDTDEPSGRYWPADSFITLHHQCINNASAYIGDMSYSEVTEEKNILPHQELHYLGYFINPTSHEMIYLYGVKDKIVPNDAQEETVIDHDIDDDNDSEDDE
ncbi:MAG: hypothetical protein Q8Q60_04070 [Candidatus Chromulinivorax sp.]|nr:hypothetical protein [Candidatus Chromulinivorax sp.]